MAPRWGAVAARTAAEPEGEVSALLGELAGGEGWSGRLAAFGHALRRPHADFLRDGVYELRARHGRVNYRILYFFHGRDMVVLAHALTKEGKVPPVEIGRALERKQDFERDPAAHTHHEDTHDGPPTQDR